MCVRSCKVRDCCVEKSFPQTDPSGNKTVHVHALSGLKSVSSEAVLKNCSLTSCVTLNVAIKLTSLGEGSL